MRMRYQPNLRSLSWLLVRGCLSMLALAALSLDTLRAVAQSSAAPNNASVLGMDIIRPTPATVSASNLAVPSRAWRELKKAKEALSREDYGNAGRHSAAALQMAPDFPGALAIRGYLHYLGNDYDAAMFDLDRAIALDPNAGVYLLLRGTILVDLDRPDEALLSLDRYSSMQPHSWACAYVMAFAWLKKKNHALASEEADRSIAWGAPIPRVHVARADALIGLHRYGEAKKEFEAYLAVEPVGDFAAAAKEAIAEIQSVQTEKKPLSDP